MLRRLLISLLNNYKRWISPFLPPSCRFHPTCSEYMIEALNRYGPWRGMLMGLHRLTKCHPFHSGGFDPVP